MNIPGSELTSNAIMKVITTGEEPTTMTKLDGFTVRYRVGKQKDQKSLR